MKVKGEKNGLCNITACQGEDDVTWFNYSTQKYYCVDCARRLNEDPHNKAWALDNNKPPLCEKDETPKKFVLDLTEPEKIVTFEEEYDGETIVDIFRDVPESFNEDFNPKMADIPKDEHGFCDGRYTVTIEFTPNKFKEE